MMEKGELRLDKGVKGSGTLSMKIRNGGDGWICSKVNQATLYKSAEIRAGWKNVANEWGNTGR